MPFPTLWMNKYALSAFIWFALFYFWGAFNLAFNKFTGRSPDYLGYAVLDRIEKYVPFKQSLFTKIGFAVFGLIGYGVSL